MRPQEIWARSYSQWVAQKSGDGLLLDQLESAVRESGKSMLPEQWAAQDFAPVAAEIERLMQEMGWL